MGRTLGSLFKYEMTDPDAGISEKIFRIVINSMMLLTNFRYKKSEPDNSAYINRLESYVAKARKGKGSQTLEEAERNLRLVPQAFTFDQDIKLYDVVHSGPRDSSEHGHCKRRHWRRGHWRNQKVGTGRQAIRHLFVRPAMIHADQITSLSDTSVLYRRPLEPIERPCISCKKPFLAQPHQELCSDPCRLAHARAQRQATYAASMSFEAAQLLALLDDTRGDSPLRSPLYRW